MDFFVFLFYWFFFYCFLCLFLIGYGTHFTANIFDCFCTYIIKF